MQKLIVDSDVLSLVQRRHKQVTYRVQDYLRNHSSLSFSVITQYEILRGLKARSASVQLEQFSNLCDASEILPVTLAIGEIAANIYARLSSRGQTLADADILIAATAIAADCPLATNNVRHFSRIDGLRIENWMA